MDQKKLTKPPGKLRTALQFHGVDAFRQPLGQLFQILVHPVRYLGEAGYSVLGLAAPGQAVALAVEEAEAGWNAELLQGGEHLQALAHIAAVIPVGVDEEGGSFRLVRELYGGLVADQLGIPPHVAPDYLFAVAQAHVGVEVLGQPV